MSKHPPVEQGLATTAPQPLAKAEMSVEGMMAAIIQKDITTDSVAVMTQLVALKERMDATAAKRSCSTAFAALQRECRPIAATTVVQNKGSYVKYEDLRRAVDPLIDRHGFSLTFSQKLDGPLMTVVCRLTHCDGHEISSDFTCRRVTVRNNNEAQDDVATNTTACRKCLVNILGIVEDHSEDARMLGNTIDAAEAAEIEERCKALAGDDNASLQRFLKLGAVQKFSDLKRAKADVVWTEIDRQENAQAAPAPKPAKAPVSPLRKTVAEKAGAWSGLPDDELPAVVRAIADLIGIVRPLDGYTDQQLGMIVTWLDAAVAKGKKFPDALNK